MCKILMKMKVEIMVFKGRDRTHNIYIVINYWVHTLMLSNSTWWCFLFIIICIHTLKRVLKVWICYWDFFSLSVNIF